MITQIIEGMDGISHYEFSWYPGRAQNVDDDRDTIVERFHEDIIDQRWHQVKGMMKRKVIGTRGTTQTQNQACCSRQNDMTRKIAVGLAHRRKLFREEGPGSTVKIEHDNGIKIYRDRSRRLISFFNEYIPWQDFELVQNGTVKEGVLAYVARCEVE